MAGAGCGEILFGKMILDENDEAVDAVRGAAAQIGKIVLDVEAVIGERGEYDGIVRTTSSHERGKEGDT